MPGSICHETIADKDAIFNNKKAIRGGIPLVFPHFGPWGEGRPQHGFARTSLWKLSGQNKDRKSGDVSATFTMEDSEETRKIWNYSFKLTYTVTLKAKSLLLEFTVDNKGQEAFDFTCLLHTYLGVDDITQTSVVGLQGTKYDDKVTGQTDCTEENEEVTISGETDRIYKSTPNELTVKNTKGGKSVIIKKNNFPDAVVWNPWIEKAKAMSDFGDDEYLVMLCVEAGFVAKPFHLEPSETFQASQELSLA
ncbi:putative glucose-6-phosphate 1-epimerase [Apostichopus japonicus]|uniref:Galactose mutarotase n=1 Tax=Stichopus japonicus TaxID=307972 RepID=A0A2G8LLQ6_STIJA|nr:putative glucose-6-phosphate 1-epimerase [Apostichopus japonicus]